MLHKNPTTPPMFQWLAWVPTMMPTHLMQLSKPWLGFGFSVLCLKFLTLGLTCIHWGSTEFIYFGTHLLLYIITRTENTQRQGHSAFASLLWCFPMHARGCPWLEWIHSVINKLDKHNHLLIRNRCTLVASTNYAVLNCVMVHIAFTGCVDLSDEVKRLLLIAIKTFHAIIM